MNGLVEFLAYKTECTYISDLPRCKYVKLIRIMKKIPANRYPLSEWNNAISYIYGKKVEFRTVGEVKKFICRGCWRNIDK